MRIISKKTLRGFWQSKPEFMSAKDALEAWHDEAKKAAWRTPAEIKAKYRSASILKGNRVVFNIKGNDYRLVVKVNYDYGIVYVRFVGTHRQYDAIDVETV
ncbi:MAG TPA: addiction module toxin RelE [Oceanospirillaceae bacterium]|nr:addiction module toxin RelE [Oceanospirillaceae bacterium]